MTIYVELQALLQVHDADRDVLEGVFFGMGDTLTDLESQVSLVLDHAVSVDLGRGLLQLDVTAAGESFGEADRAAKSAVILAIVNTGGAIDDAQSGLSDLLRGHASVVTLPGVDALDEQLRTAGVEVHSRQLALAI